MELKFVLKRHISFYIRFELNLYGIEIKPLSCINIAYQSFELNLYGIEILPNPARLKAGMGLNWTFMELKLFQSFRQSVRSSVWIEPLWNWNYDYSLTISDTQTFELNLYGIEMFWIQMHIVEQNRFELNLYGIEIIYLDLYLHLEVAVWIEPLWNWNRFSTLIISNWW